MAKPLSSVDTAWLRMEDPTNLMMITGVIVLGAPLDLERLKATIEQRLLRFDRFRQRVVRPPLGTPYWENDPAFDINYHLQRATLPPPGNQAALQETASLMASRQLDPARPLWQFHLIDGYGDGCALICRLHHCIGDGLALVHVLLSLTDSSPDTPWPVAWPQARRRRQHHPLGKVLQPAHSTFKVARQVTGTLARECNKVCSDPSRLAGAGRLGARGAAAMGRLVFRWPDPKTLFKGDLGVSKQVAWSAALPLQDVKSTGKALGGTVNDVLLTAMSGGLRRYLQDREQSVEGLNFRGIIPVNLRRPGTEEELGNKFGLVFLSLPVGIADPIDRLSELKRRMDGLKDSLEAPVAFSILTTIGLAPQPIQDIVVSIFGTKGTAVMTNVMGPRKKIYLAGVPLDSLMFWVPQSGRLGLGVSILSYAGQVWMGVITDAGLVPDPGRIIAAFETEFQEMLRLAQQVETAVAPPETVVELAQQPDLCQALTRSGQPCKNRPMSGSNYCNVHQERVHQERVHQERVHQEQ